MTVTATGTSRIDLGRDIAGLGKPRITVFVLITTAIGIFVAPQSMPWIAGMLSICATGLLVAAANTLNCYIERDTDARMERTRKRPLPDGRIPANWALGVGLMSAAIAVPTLVLAANRLTATLGLAALLIYVLAYTPLKRVGPFALQVGAFAGAMPPLMGWAAATGRIGGLGAVLFAILFLWQMPHFLALSLLYEEDYRRGGIATLSVRRGPEVARRRLPIWAGALTITSLLALPVGAAGLLYAVPASLAGLGFVAVAWAAGRESSASLWARRAFLYSLAYLPIVLGALLLDAR